MKSPKYRKWVKSLKEGDIVLLMENHSIWSCPVIFQVWNGDSSSNGYRAHHIYIPNWDLSSYWLKGSNEKKEEQINENWERVYEDIEKQNIKSRYFDISTVNANAEQRYFPFPKEFLTKKQLKFVNLINQIKGYEY